MAKDKLVSKFDVPPVCNVEACLSSDISVMLNFVRGGYAVNVFLVVPCRVSSGYVHVLVGLYFQFVGFK